MFDRPTNEVPDSRVQLAKAVKTGLNEITRRDLDASWLTCRCNVGMDCRERHFADQQGTRMGKGNKRLTGYV